MTWIVAKVAKLMGYETKAFHGTRSGKFDSFYPMSHFGATIQQAKDAGRMGGLLKDVRVERVFLKGKMFRMSDRQVNDDAVLFYDGRDEPESLPDGFKYDEWVKSELPAARFLQEQGYAGVETILMHESGEWISNKLLLACKKQDPQAMGSAITYARRYSYQSVLGIPSEDDDGEKSMQRGSSAPQMTQAPKITPVQSQELISLFQSKGALAGDAFMKHLKDNFGADKFANLDATQFTAVKGQLEGIQ